MADFERVTREHVLQVLDEYDTIGSIEFLGRYGFGRAREYVLHHDGKAYDSKAVLGVAHLRATGVLATSHEFSGGREGAAAFLRALGFSVDGPGGGHLGPVRQPPPRRPGEQHDDRPGRSARSRCAPRASSSSRRPASATPAPDGALAAAGQNVPALRARCSAVVVCGPHSPSGDADPQLQRLDRLRPELAVGGAAHPLLQRRVRHRARLPVRRHPEGALHRLPGPRPHLAVDVERTAAVRRPPARAVDAYAG